LNWKSFLTFGFKDFSFSFYVKLADLRLKTNIFDNHTIANSF